MKGKLVILAASILYESNMMCAQNASDNQNNAGINGTHCSAFGASALLNNAVAGASNTAIGSTALYVNTTGSQNTAAGYAALYNNNAGANTAIGRLALTGNTTGGRNTAAGSQALISTTSGSDNTAAGYRAGWINSTGSKNTALGYNATFSGNNAQNQTAIGSYATTTQDNMVRIGDSNILDIETQASGWTTFSDGRFKFNISEDDVKGLNFINLLRPVAYNMNTRKKTAFITADFPPEIRSQFLDRDFSKSTAKRRTGFIAQEVESAALDAGYLFNGLHKPGNDRSTYSISYELFVVPLVKAIQEQQVFIEECRFKFGQQQRILESIFRAGEAADNNGPDYITGDSFEAGYHISIRNVINTKGNVEVSCRIPIDTKAIAVGIYDLRGRQVGFYPLNPLEPSIKISKAGLYPGIYTCSLITEGMIVGSTSLLIEEK